MLRTLNKKLTGIPAERHPENIRDCRLQLRDTGESDGFRRCLAFDLSVISASAHGLYVDLAVLIRLVSGHFVPFSRKAYVAPLPQYLRASWRVTRRGDATRQNNETERKSQIVWFLSSPFICNSFSGSPRKTSYTSTECRRGKH